MDYHNIRLVNNEYGEPHISITCPHNSQSEEKYIFYQNPVTLGITFSSVGAIKPECQNCPRNKICQITLGEIERILN